MPTKTGMSGTKAPGMSGVQPTVGTPTAGLLDALLNVKEHLKNTIDSSLDPFITRLKELEMPQGPPQGPLPDGPPREGPPPEGPPPEGPPPLSPPPLTKTATKTATKTGIGIQTKTGIGIQTKTGIGIQPKAGTKISTPPIGGGRTLRKRRRRGASRR